MKCKTCGKDKGKHYTESFYCGLYSNQKFQAEDEIILKADDNKFRYINKAGDVMEVEIQQKGCGKIYYLKKNISIYCHEDSLCPSCSNQSLTLASKKVDTNSSEDGLIPNGEQNPPSGDNQSPSKESGGGKAIAPLVSSAATKTLSDFVYQLGNNPPEIQAKYVRDFIKDLKEEMRHVGVEGFGTWVDEVIDKLAGKQLI